MQTAKSWSIRALRVYCGAFAFLASESLSAQAPRGADTLSAQAIADSQAVIAQLAAHLKGNQRDAQSWTRMGMVAWALYERSKSEGAGKLDATKLGRMADTSLRIAAGLQPDNAIAQLAVGDFLLATGLTTSRNAAIGYFKAALAAGRADGIDSIHAHAALSLGLVSWRRYEALANRRLSSNSADIGRSLNEALRPIAKVSQALEAQEAFNRESEIRQLLGGSVAATGIEVVTAGAGTDAASGTVRSLNSVRNIIETQSKPLPPSVTGGSELMRADSLFEEAYRSQPANPAAFRAAAMIRAERSDWVSLESLARAHRTRFPDDVQAGLALGLALQRLGKTRAAAAVFDSALARLPYYENRRIDRPGRIVPPSNAGQTDLNWSVARNAFGSAFWGMGDPIWSDDVAERQVEFRARVAYAELRWTVEDADVRGADTDRGDVYIRYGPPDLIAAFGPNISENASDIMTFWIYNSGMIFAFSSMSGFSTARIPPADRQMIEALKAEQPARWDNLNSPHVDSIFTRLTQFRAGNDSVEMVVTSLTPFAGATSSRGRMWMLSSAGVMTFSDSSAISSSGTTGFVAGMFTGFEYIVHVEAATADSQRHGRFQTYLRRDAVIPTSGRGISDILVASTATESNAPLKRWRDAKAVPSVGALDRGERFWLIWENYDLARENGSLNYDVKISIARRRSTPGKIAASVVGALANIAHVIPGEDKTDVAYTRTVPETDVAVEMVALDLLTTPPGDYDLTVEVTDKVAKQTLTRTLRVTVREGMTRN